MKKNMLWRHFLNIVLIWLVLVPITQFLVWWSVAHVWPEAGSLQGGVTRDALTFIYHVSAIIFVMVTVVIAYLAIAFKTEPDDKRNAEVHAHAFGPFTMTWLFLSIMINIVVFIYPGMFGMEQLWNLQHSAKNPLVVVVTGQRWHWSYTYPKQGIYGASVLEVPVNRPIKFVVKTLDVMHSFWVPLWGYKISAVPGETRSFVITPTEKVTTAENPLARVQCNWDCGLGHAQMRSVVKVVSQKQFKQWVASQSF